MRLTAVALVNWCDVNGFSYANQWTIRAGDPNTLYFQIIDLDKGPSVVIGQLNPLFGFGAGTAGNPTLSGNVGLRYIVGVGVDNQPASIKVTFPALDDTQVIQATAIQDPDDGSIWRVVLLPSQLPKSGNIKFEVTEGNSTRRFSVTNMLAVELLNSGSC